MLRYKHPEVDLKLAYPKVMARSVGISIVFLLVLAVMFPSFEMETPARVRRPDRDHCRANSRKSGIRAVLSPSGPQCRLKRMPTRCLKT